MSNQPSSNDKKTIDFHEFLNACKYRKKWFIVALLFAIAFSAFKYLRSYTTYDVTAKIMMFGGSDASAGLSLVRQFSIGGLLGGNGAVDDEIKVLQSHSVMVRTVKQLDLNVKYLVRPRFLKNVPTYGDNVPVKLAYDEAILDTLGPSINFRLTTDKAGLVSAKAKVGGKTIGEITDQPFPATMSTPWGDFTLEKTPAYVEGKPLNEKISLMSYDVAAEDYLKHILISIPDKKSNMIELAIQTSDPEFGKTLLDSLVANYNERGMEELRNRDMKTVELIERRLLTLGEDLANAELGIESFQKDQNLIDIPTQAEQALVKSYELQTLIETAKTELDLLKNTLNFFKNEDNKYNLIPMESSETGGIFNEMIAAYNEQVVERMNLSLGARPNNEALKIQNKKIDAIRENLLSTFGKAYENTKIRYDEQVALKRQLDAQLAQVPNKQRVFRAIGRDQAVKEQLYLFLLQQHEEKSISVENAQPRAMIVDEAYTYPESHNFSLKNLLLLVIFIGFVVPAGIVFVTELLRNKLSRSTKMSSLTSVPLLGDVEVEKNSQLIAMREGGSDSMIEDFRKLRANLDYILPDKSEKVVLVTGLSATDKAAVVAVNLAAACAMTGKRVVVVDADVRDGKLLESLDIALEYGLTDYLGGDQSTIDKIVTRETSAAAPFDIIGAGRSTILGVELLTSDRMADLLDKLRESYDKVIIMAAPMSRYADAYALGDFVDASIVVVTSEKTPFGAFETINECAADERLPKLSIVRLTNQIFKKKK